MEDYSYFGGLIDGDGSAGFSTLTISPNRTEQKPFISLAMIDYDTVKRCHDLFGGHFCECAAKPNNTPPKQITYYWCVAYRKALAVAKVLYKYTFLKRDKLIAIMSYYGETAGDDLILGDSYISGITDAEGCIYWKRSSNPSYRYPIIQVSMSDKVVIDKCVELTGLGKVYVCVGRGENKQGEQYKTMYMWHIGGRSSLALAKLILPYSITKRDKLQEIMDFYGENHPARIAGVERIITHNYVNKMCVNKLDKNGGIISMYESISAAARDCNLSPGSIAHVCHSERKTAGGFHWRFTEEKEKENA